MQKDEVGEREVSELILVEGKDTSVEVEGKSVSLEGSAEDMGVENLTVEGMKACIPRTDLAEAIKDDKSLSHIYELGKLDKEGYHITNDILFRTRLDVFGQTVEQICLPTSYRQ